MTDQSPPTENPSGLDRAKLSKEFKDLLTPLNILLLIALAALLLIGVFGGWGNLADSKKAVPAKALGKAVEAAPFKVTIRKMLWFDNVPKVYRTAPGQRALLVSVDIVNASDRYVTGIDVDRAFQLEGVALVDETSGKPIATDKTKPIILRGSDSFKVYSLQPDIPTSVALIWFQDSKLPPPKTLTIRVNKQRYRQSALDGSLGYFDAAPAFEVTAPLTRLNMP